MRASRLKREVEILRAKGVPVWSAATDGSAPEAGHVRVVVEGPAESPYAGGAFEIDVQAGDRFPLEPPRMQFVTPVWHPNVDEAGRICLSLLKPGGWKPSLTVCTVLQAVQQLLSEPNGDDALVAEIGAEFLRDRARFEEKAAAHTRLHARPQQQQQQEEGRPPQAKRPKKEGDADSTKETI